MKTSIQKIVTGIATLGPIGALPGSGTWASLFAIPFAYALVLSGLPYVLCVSVITIISVGIVHTVLPSFAAHDPHDIVLDEVVGCLWVLYMTEWSWWYCILYVIVFRFFDITKIMGIRLVERLPGVIGIFADDCVAAVFARIFMVFYWLFVS